MKTPLLIKETTIERAIQKHFGIEIGDLEFIPKGEGAWLYSCTTSTGKKMVVKIQKKPRKLESDIYQGLGRAGYKWMPRFVVTLKSKKIWAKEGKYHYSIQEYLNPGANSHLFVLDDIYLPSLGRALKDLHTIKLPKHITARIRHEKYIPQHYKQLERSFIKIKKARPKKYQALKQLYLDNEQLLREFLELALQRGQELKKLRLPMVLVHGDVHPFNILRPDDEVYLTDWEVCRIAQAENDFMYFDDRQLKLMSKGYGRNLLKNRVALDYYRIHLRIRELYFFGYELAFEASSEKQRKYGRDEFKEACTKIRKEFF